jgi:hypothetical protein
MPMRFIPRLQSARLAPVLLAAGVHRDIAVADLLQHARRDVRVLAAAARAVDDDLGGCVGHDAGRELARLVVREMQRARQVPVVVVLRRQGFEQHQLGVGGQARLQFVAGDGLVHGQLLSGGL